MNTLNLHCDWLDVKCVWFPLARGITDRLRKKARKSQVSRAEKKGVSRDTLLTLEEMQAVEALYLNKIKSWCLDPKEARTMNERLVLEDPSAADAVKSSSYAKTLFWTSVIYLKRFFLKNCMLKYNPFIMRAVAVYVAGKVEEIPLTSDLRGVRVDRLGTLANTAPEMIVESEIAFLGGIDFELSVFSPQRPLDGLFEDLRAREPSKAKIWKSLETVANTILQNCIFSDVIFLHSPSRIAFAAILAAHGEAKKKPDFTIDELFQWLLPEGIEAPESLKEDLVQLGESLKENKGVVKKVGVLLRASPNAENWVRKWTKHCAKLPANKPVKRKHKDGEDGNKGDNADAKIEEETKEVKVKKEPKIKEEPGAEPVKKKRKKDKKDKKEAKIKKEKMVKQEDDA